MPCSAVTLSIATIFAVLSVALLGIAFGTDNWKTYLVDRTVLQTSSEISREKLETDVIYFYRTRGLFRICFPKQIPRGVQTYQSPIETSCINIDYYIPDNDDAFKQFDDDRKATIHMARSIIAVFIVAFFFVAMAFLVGIVGCWQRSPGKIMATALMMLCTALFSGLGMGLWHAVEYYEYERLNHLPEDYKRWPQPLRDNTDISIDWSYYLAWIGVGCALVSFMLFSGAWRCLKNEKIKEERQKMSYLMPVYPQKQQYQYAYAYPGPYYHNGYGPGYNY